MNRFIHHAALLAGLACIAWVGAGYAGSGHPVALAVTALIGAFFLCGALELHRLRQATAQLAGVLARTGAPPAALQPWLEQLPVSLRHAVRLRIEGQRAALPGPALTPYLAGLLVLLGMLGTFLGMVVTLRGTGLALQGAVDLASVRAALAAPVAGLGVAFGTSLAGVAASAMLGLAAALTRRDRQLAGQQLDQLLSTVLRPFSEAQRRDDAFTLLRQQADAMPALVERLDALVQGIERQSQGLHERLLADQQGFHGRTEAAYNSLASAVDRSLKDSLAESARLAGAAIQPAVEATMAGVAREAAALHAGAAQGVQQQLEQLAQRFASSAEGVAQAWTDALADQRRTQAQQGSGLQDTLDGFAQTFAQRSAQLVEQVTDQLGRTAGGLEQRWHDQLAQQAQAHERLAGGTQQALVDTTARFAQHADALRQTVEQAHARLQQEVDARDAQRLAAWADALAQHERSTQALAAQTQQALAGTAAGFGAHAAALQQGAAQAQADLQAQAAARDSAHLAAWNEALARHEQAQQALAASTGEALDSAARGFVQQVAALQEQVVARDGERLAAWTTALAQHERASQSLATDTQQALARTAEGFDAHVATLQQGVAQAHADLQAQAAARDVAQLAAWNEALARHEQAQQALAASTGAALDGAASGLVQRVADWQEQVAARDSERLATWTEALAQHERATQAHGLDARQALARTATDFETHVATLQQGVAQAHADLQAQAAARDAAQLAAWNEALARHEQAQQALAASTGAALDGAASGLVQRVADWQEQVAARDSERLAAWTEALAQHERATQAHGTEARQALASAADGFSHHAAVLQATVTQAHADLQAQAGTRDAARLADWNAALAATTATLGAQWREASDHGLAQQQRICAALAETAQAMGERAQAQASATVAEIGRLVDAAAQAPRAAAEVIAELRDKLTDSMARDNAMLDERARVLDTLRTLLDAVNHASSEQRVAIDALVSGSTEVLERAGERFAAQIEGQGSRLADAAAQLGAGAAEVASLGEAFGAAVELFSASNTQLGAHLQQVDDTLGRSIARSDEQLAYYVAQAREVIDLSLLSQKQIVEDLQRLANERSAQATTA
jgi:hypothetical protein